jgi:hypothetical protein
MKRIMKLDYIGQLMFSISSMKVTKFTGGLEIQVQTFISRLEILGKYLWPAFNQPKPTKTSTKTS